ncbi:hypothetical protein Pan14r_33100 [Crateriforma conspicua]|uniref:Uncharacterized protein YyaB-like PH domain-containing protein n=2 Tax=Crateriforma conspicua TaxID=2527996 RepID=A0A5C5Y6U7_9PLAN|nr:hypothetical protein Mal65_47740 [Crateriforma conspicua]TWT71000.1 hypothetical protein Pan14r_33100 [Crateriforma conspicua]
MPESSLPHRHPEVFPSAIDRWLILVVTAGPFIATAAGIHTWLHGNPNDAAMLFLAGAGALLLTLLFMLPCRYTLSDDTLAIRCGLIVFHVPVNEITDLRPTSTLLSGPALSLRRVEIKTRNRRYIVSPRDRERFISTLRAAAKLPDASF